MPRKRLTEYQRLRREKASPWYATKTASRKRKHVMLTLSEEEKSKALQLAERQGATLSGYIASLIEAEWALRYGP